MTIVTFTRIIRTGFVTFWRNIWLSLATTAIMVLTLFAIGLLFLTNVLSNRVIETIEEKVDISVYLYDDAETDLVNAAHAELQTHPDIADVRFISKEEALEIFKKNNADNPLVLQSLEEIENPLQASFIIRAESPDRYEAIAQYLKQPKFDPIIAKVNYEDSDNRTLIRRLTVVTNTARRASFVLTGILGAIAILVMYSTIRLTIYGYREEIEIMHLVGASPWFIRGPFLVNGILYGVIATIVAMLLLLPVLKVVSPHATTFFGTEGFSIYAYLATHLFRTTLLLLGIGVTLGIVSSLIAVGRYMTNQRTQG